MDTARNLFNITASTPGTEVAADAAAALASAYMAFESVDPDYATKLLKEAKAVSEANIHSYTRFLDPFGPDLT